MYEPLGRWILVTGASPVGEDFIHAIVDQAGPLAEVTPGQAVLLDAGQAGHEAPDAYPSTALVAREDGTAWVPEPGWTLLTQGTGSTGLAWFVLTSRAFDVGAQVLVADGSTTLLEGTTYIVADVAVIAYVTP